MLMNKDRAQRLMREEGLDAIIATGPENVAYIADYYCLSHWNNKGTPVFAVLPADDSTSPCLITLALEYTALAEEPSWITDVRLHGTSYAQIGIRRAESLVPEDEQIARVCMSQERHQGWLDVLTSALSDRGLLKGRLGLDESGLPYTTRQAIIDALPGAAILDVANLLRRVRMVKTPKEIQRLRRASQITEIALQEMMAAIRPGINERDLVHLYNAKVASLGGIPTLTLVTAGRRAGHPHALTADYLVQPGDMVKIDLGCTYRLYWADTARTKVVGEPTEQQRRVHAALLAGEQAALMAIRPGVKPSRLFEIAVQTVRESGIPDYQRHHVGHGMGIEVYDHPLIQPASARSELSGLGGMDVPLEPGMVLNIECPFYLIGEWGLNVEDTVVVTETGVEFLTHLERGLML